MGKVGELKRGKQRKDQLDFTFDVSVGMSPDLKLDVSTPMEKKAKHDQFLRGQGGQGPKLARLPAIALCHSDIVTELATQELERKGSKLGCELGPSP